MITKTATDQFLDWLEERLGEDDAVIAEAYLDDVRDEIRKDTFEEVSHRDELVRDVMEMRKQREDFRSAMLEARRAEQMEKKRNLEMGL